MELVAISIPKWRCVNQSHLITMSGIMSHCKCLGITVGGGGGGVLFDFIGVSAVVVGILGKFLTLRVCG